MGHMPDPQPQESHLFPKIFRFITERSIVIIITVVSLFVLTGIVLQGIRLQDTFHQVELAKQQRSKLTQELAYWQDIVRQYGNYRDAYFRIAILQYQLGEVSQAKKSLEKVLALDPNFEKARVLGEKISAQ
jgi:tetratricopeptide (TPR) repeat protein